MSFDAADRAPTGAAGAPPSEEELRAAYEAELDRVTSVEVVLQSAVSLLNVGGRRLNPVVASSVGQASESPPGAGSGGAGGGPDLEQVRDAIDGVRALLPILERRMAAELGPLRQALSQLQMAYAREAHSGEQAPASASEAAPGSATPGSEATPGSGAAPPAGEQPPSGRRPGPAEASGRLWVPGR